MKKQRKVNAWLFVFLFVFIACSAGFRPITTAYADPEDENPIVDPEPMPVDPEPTPVDPDPTPVDPEPTPVDPTPTPVDPTPTPVSPTPAPGNTTPTPGNQTEENADDALQATSEDVMLSELSISCGQLNPAFSPNTFHYTVYVTKDQTPKNAAISASAANSEALVEVTGPDTWDTKDIQREVNITLGNQHAAYQIDIHVLKATELYVNGSLYAVPDKLSLGDLPKGFEEVTTLFSDENIVLAKNPDGSLLLTEFVNEQGDSLWYRVDMKNESLSPVQLVQKNGETFVEIGGEVELLYGDDGTGKGYYAYDAKTGQLVFYLNPTGTVKLPEVQKSVTPVMIIMAAVAAACLIGFVVALLQCRKWKKQSKSKGKYFRPYISLPDNENEQN